MIQKNFFIDDANAQEYIAAIGEFIKSSVNAANREGVVLGMSGGIDCCVTARLCQAAGVKIKLAVLPDGCNMKTSEGIDDAMLFINKFGFNYQVINIKKICSAIEKKIGGQLDILSKTNIRPRVRMTILYSIAQKNRCFVIGTSNLNERMIGYFTKWGDGAYDINPLALLTKGEIRTLARYLDVPSRIISKPPSADLFKGQTDETDIGFSYEQMDKFFLKGSSGNNEIDAAIKKRVGMSEHKLLPAPVFMGLPLK